MLMAKFETFFEFFTFLKREIPRYLVNFFKVSGRSIEEILMSTQYVFWRINDETIIAETQRDPLQSH